MIKFKKILFLLIFLLTFSLFGCSKRVDENIVFLEEMINYISEKNNRKIETENYILTKKDDLFLLEQNNQSYLIKKDVLYQKNKNIFLKKNDVILKNKILDIDNNITNDFKKISIIKKEMNYFAVLDDGVFLKEQTYVVENNKNVLILKNSIETIKIYYGNVSISNMTFWKNNNDDCKLKYVSNNSYYGISSGNNFLNYNIKYQTNDVFVLEFETKNEKIILKEKIADVLEIMVKGTTENNLTKTKYIGENKTEKDGYVTISNQNAENIIEGKISIEKIIDNLSAYNSYSKGTNNEMITGNLSYLETHTIKFVSDEISFEYTIYTNILEESFISERQITSKTSFDKIDVLKQTINKESIFKLTKYKDIDPICILISGKENRSINNETIFANSNLAFKSVVNVGEVFSN